MFSGIISDIGRVLNVELDKDRAALAVDAALFADAKRPCALGESIAVSGVCLTITQLRETTAWFDLSSETLRCTGLGELTTGAIVNLERSLLFGDRLDGHLVLGHVDAVAKVISRTEEQGTVCFRIGLPPALADMIAPKGSVAVDGISLTVGEVLQDDFTVFIIPYTLQHTSLRDLRPGMSVNLEVDCLARYVVRAAEAYLSKITRRKINGA